MSNPAYLFGAKLANKVQFYERVPQDKQKKKNPVMRAEAAGESDDTPEFKFDNLDKESAAYKFGKSMCQPCDMSKHDRSKYQTGPMRALSAEEAVKPEDGGVTETEKTEHSETNIHNSGQKTSAVKQAKGGVFAQLGDSVAQGMRQTMKRPPLPPPPPKLKTTGAPAPTGAPKLTPREMAEMQRMNQMGQGYSLPASQANQPVAVRAATQNADAAMRARLEAGGGTPAELQKVMGPTINENAARLAGANRKPPAIPPLPPKR
jgi:hypothetical protein